MKQITYQEAIELMAFAGRKDILIGRLAPAVDDTVGCLCDEANAGALFFIPGTEKSEPAPEMESVPVPGASGETVKLLKPKRESIDDGKIMALKTAGWSVAKIADEIGTSQNTIYNHIKKMEGKAYVDEDK